MNTLISSLQINSIEVVNSSDLLSYFVLICTLLVKMFIDLQGVIVAIIH